MLREFRLALELHFGERLRAVVLYGSYARGDYHDESDIDLMITLNDGQLNSITEVWSLSDLQVDFLDRYGKIISPLVVPHRQYEYSFGPIYQNARQEGILI
jgi:predicted nucleotidyltransferase